MSDLPMVVRGPLAADGGFLLDSWVRSYAQSWAVKKIPTWLYYERQRGICARLLERCTVLVACDQKDPRVIWGWTCAESIDGALVVHYTYVKEFFRGNGVASSLIKTLLDAETRAGFETAALIWTHDTKSTNSFLRGLREAGIVPDALTTFYNPYLVSETLADE